MTILILYLLLALVVSFMCSILEAVLLSTSYSFIKLQENKGLKSAKMLAKLKGNIDRPLSAILSLNTFAHTIGAAGVGSQVVKLYGDAYFGIASGILTLMILFITEIIPKTIGAKYWQSLALISGQIIYILIIITYPLVVISTYITKTFSKHDNIQLTTSREEISVLAKIGTAEGVFGEKENKIIQNLMRLKSLKVSDIITPRVVITMADEEMTLEEFLQNKSFLHFSRIPVYSNTNENITGYVFRQSIFEKLAELKKDLKLKDIKRKIFIVNSLSPIFYVWEDLLIHKEHIALVVDEYGGIDGIVTMEDIIETLLGFEIVDEKDTISDMQQYAKERWKMRQKKYDLLTKK